MLMTFVNKNKWCYNSSIKNINMKGIREMQEFITQYKEIITLLALIGIEILPIKISPFTWAGKVVGKLLGIDELKDKIDKVEEKVDTNELDRIKYEILQFSGSLRNGLKRTDVDYQHIEELFSKYTKKGGNSYIANEMAYIRNQHNKDK